MTDKKHEIPDLRTTGAAEDIKDDRLERKHFVKNLAQAIRRYRGGKSLTVGLHGPWGSGKSTLLNFVAQELKTDKSNIVVGRFNPWNFSDNDRLLSSFFRFFSGLLKHGEDAKKLKTAASWIDGLAELAEPAGNIADLLSLPIGLIPGGGAAISGAKAISKLLKERAGKLSDVEHLKTEISKALRDADRRLVIIMDDLDRLPQHEIRQVFQLIKAGADFDNVVYVVAFERGIVSRALDKFAPGQGERYLEKVINIPFNLPQMTIRQIHRLLIDELNRYTERQREYDWNNERLRSIIETVKPYFKTLRLIDMLSNLLIMMEGMVKDDVDFTDHIGLTMLQVLEPKIHEFVANNPHLFVDTTANRLLRAKDADKEEVALIEAAFKERLQSISLDDVISVLSQLFPKMKHLFDDGSNEFGRREWYIEQRACADYELFSRFFRFEVDEADLSAKDVVELLEASKNRDALTKVLGTAADDADRVHRTLERLGDMAKADVSREQIHNIISVLMNVTDELPEHQGLAEFFFGSVNESVNTISALLGVLPDKADRAAIVMDVLGAIPKSVALVTRFVETNTTVRAKHIAEPRLFADGDVPEIRRLAGVVVESRFVDSTIFDYPRGVSQLYSWFRLAQERSRDVIREVTGKDDFVFLRFIKMFTNLRINSRYEPTPLDLKTLAEMFTVNEIGERLVRIRDEHKTDELAAEAQGLLTIYEEQLAETKAEEEARAEAAAHANENDGALPPDAIETMEL